MSEIETDKKERACELAGAPICPACRGWAEFVGRFSDAKPGVPEAVKCSACTWAGEYVRIKWQ